MKKPNEYRVILLGFTEKEPNKSRREKVFASAYHGWKEAFIFPIGGLVVGLNRLGEPVVIPDHPAHSIVLHFFDYVLE